MRCPFAVPGLAVFLAGCLATRSEPPDLPCEMNWETVSQDDSSLGFTAADVVAWLKDNLPSRVVWDELTLTESEDDVHIEIGDISGDVQVSREPGIYCWRADPSLGIPVAMTITIGDSEVVAQGVPRVIAYAISRDDIYVDTGRSLPAVLSGTYASAEASHFAEADETQGSTQTGVFVVISPLNAWVDSVVDIEVTGVSPDSWWVAAFWRGHWRFE